MLSHLKYGGVVVVVVAVASSLKSASAKQMFHGSFASSNRKCFKSKWWENTHRNGCSEHEPGNKDCLCVCVDGKVEHGKGQARGKSARDDEEIIRTFDGPARKHCSKSISDQFLSGTNTKWPRARVDDTRFAKRKVWSIDIIFVIDGAKWSFSYTPCIGKRVAGGAAEWLAMDLPHYSINTYFRCHRFRFRLRCKSNGEMLTLYSVLCIGRAYNMARAWMRLYRWPREAFASITGSYGYIYFMWIKNEI